MSKCSIWFYFWTQNLIFWYNIWHLDGDISCVFAANSQQRIRIGKRYKWHPILKIWTSFISVLARVSNNIQNVLSVFKTSSDDLKHPSVPKRAEYISLAFFLFNFSMFSLSVKRHRTLTKQRSDLFWYHN